MKKDETQPKWVDNLRALIAHRQFNPRSLSLAAGLNATAVRDMLEGRARFPRYDTVEALSKALGVTPAQLMAGKPETLLQTLGNDPTNEPLADDDLNLLTEIITRLQETAAAYKYAPKPQDFAAMVTTLYRQMNGQTAPKLAKSDLAPHIAHLISYETLRRRSSGGSQ